MFYIPPILTHRQLVDKHRLLSQLIDDPATGCKIKPSPSGRKDYAQAMYLGQQYPAHRVAAFFAGLLTEEQLTTRLPASMHPHRVDLVCHHCDVKQCCNSKHLFVGSQKDNMEDWASKGIICGPMGELHCFAKMTDKDVITARGLWDNGMSIKAVATHMHQPYMRIRAAVVGATWKHLPPAKKASMLPKSTPPEKTNFYALHAKAQITVHESVHAYRNATGITDDSGQNREGATTDNEVRIGVVLGGTKRPYYPSKS